MALNPPVRRLWRALRAWAHYHAIMARRALGLYVGRVWRWRAEVLQALGLLLGWVLLLHGLALLLPGYAREVWTLGGAALVLGLVGLRWIAGLFATGLYTASGGEEEPGPGPGRRPTWPGPVVGVEDEGEE